MSWGAAINIIKEERKEEKIYTENFAYPSVFSDNT